MRRRLRTRSESLLKLRRNLKKRSHVISKSKWKWMQIIRCWRVSGGPIQKGKKIGHWSSMKGYRISAMDVACLDIPRKGSRERFKCQRRSQGIQCMAPGWMEEGRGKLCVRSQRRRGGGDHHKKTSPGERLGLILWMKLKRIGHQTNENE